jgi:hypothetical protein
LKPGAEHALALDDEHDVVQPVDEERGDLVRLPGEVPLVSRRDRLELADEGGERERRVREELRTVATPDDQADVGLVFERLPGGDQEKTYTVAPTDQREKIRGANQIGVRTQPWLAG